MIVQKTNNNFRAIHIPNPEKILAENIAPIQPMIEVDFEEKKLVFSPFMDYDLFSISYEMDFLRHMAAVSTYFPLKLEDYDFVKQKMDISD